MVVNGDEVTYYIVVPATTDSTTAFAGSMRIDGLPVATGATSVRGAAAALGFELNVPAQSASSR